ncbi:hypothetical protein OBV_10760 [Oscillibacter valericigenes Sjm18-20]|nr:hypothetical protein OBV_10760 [Oscillibacter valericigenes Sjm18-20]
MNSFSEYMDTVKAEKELKLRTEAFVRTVLANAEGQEKLVDSGSEFKKGGFSRNKFLVAVSAAAACLILALGGSAYYHTPINYLCLDINPSVELGINAFGKVVSSQAYNEDGLMLLGDNSCLNLSVEDAVGTLVLDAARQGFIAGDGSTVIAVTAESNKNHDAAELQSSGEFGANSALNASGISAIVYADSTDLQLRKQALDLGISPGKLRLISILQILDPGISIEEYDDAKMTDIITKANELLTLSGSRWENGNDAEMFEKIRKAAERVQASFTNTEREQNRNGTQNQGQGSGEEEQNQNQNQSSNDYGTQSQVQNQNWETNNPVQYQSSGGGQQAQNPQSETQNQVQGGSASVSDKNQGQTTDTQSGYSETAQDNGLGGKPAPAPAETGADAGGSQTSSAPAETGADAGGSQTSSAPTETGADAGGSQTSSAPAETGADAGGSQTSSTPAETGADAGGSQTSSAPIETGADASGSQTSSAPAETGADAGSSQTSSAPAETGTTGGSNSSSGTPSGDGKGGR